MQNDSRHATILPPAFEPFTLPDSGKPAPDREHYADTFTLPDSLVQITGDKDRGAP